MSTPTIHDPTAAVQPELMTIAQVAQLCGVSVRGAYKLAAREGFPQPRLLSPRVSRWRRSELLAWIDTVPTAGGDRLTVELSQRMSDARAKKRAEARPL